MGVPRTLVTTRDIPAVADTLRHSAVLLGRRVLGIFETWHEIGAAGEPGFLNGWHNSDPTNASTCAFFKDSDGRVHLKGQVRYPNPQGANIFQLPAGYRPVGGIERIPVDANVKRTWAGSTIQSNQSILVTIYNTDGIINIIDTHTVGTLELTRVSLDGVSFWSR